MTLIEKLEEIKNHHALIAYQRLNDGRETELLIQRMEDGEMEKPEDWPTVKAFNLKQIKFDLEIGRRHWCMADTVGDAVRELREKASAFALFSVAYKVSQKVDERQGRSPQKYTPQEAWERLDSTHRIMWQDEASLASESQRTAAGTADEKPDGQVENNPAHQPR